MKRWIVLLPLIASSCATQQPLPTYAPVDELQTRQLIERHGEAIRTLRSSATIVLTDAKGASVSLDGVLLFERPDRLRVRAWKLGQAVFDLTITPRGVWQYVPREEAKESTRVTYSVADHLLELIGNALPANDGRTQLTEKLVRVSRTTESCMVETRDYDRRTLTLQRIEQVGEDGTGRLVLAFDAYRALGEHVWPGRIEANSVYGTVSIRFGEVEVNADLPDAAFTPPARAEQL
jgi:outer membrane lipoprotein-sorting protein